MILTFKGIEGYNTLNHLPFNRKFSVRNDLIESMNKNGFVISRLLDLIKTDIFTGKMELFIADGQHRALTASFLNIDFYGAVTKTIKRKDYETVEEAKKEIVEYVATLNSGQKPWKTINYVESYAYLGYQHYNKLLDIHNNNPYSVDTIAAILGGYRGKGYNSNKLKNGTFTITQEKEALDTLKLIKKLWKIERVTSRMALAIHYVSSLTYFDEKKFINKYKENIKSIKELNLDDYTDIFSSWL